jgi:16S rRNA (adenine1518-N6/adenine1519-N6)-dimethyltransferase
MSERTPTAKKSLGQNFLNSATVPRWLADAALVTPTDRILEIGPGTGVLTRELLNRGAIVTAIETDRRLIKILEENFAPEIARGQLNIIAADVRTTPQHTYVPETPYKLVANIPYYLSGFLLRHFLESQTPPSVLVFLMQKEVVERITRSKKSSILSLSVAAFGKATYVKTVGRGHFQPQPKVDSAILAVNDISHQALPSRELQKCFFTLLHAGFGSKRKQLAGNLRSFIAVEQLTTWLEAQKLPPTVRAEDLSIEQWLLLAHSFYPIISTRN